MRILILIVQFPPDVNTSGMLMGQLAEGLVRRGHRVSVITSFPHYENFRIWDEYRGKLFERAVYQGMRVLRLWVYAGGSKDRMLHRLLSYLSFSLMATLAAMLWREDYDVILCSNGSFFTGLAAGLIGRVKGAPFVYNVQDLYPETPVQAGQLRNKSAIAALSALERLMYGTADHISVIANAFHDNIVAKGVSENKVSVIPNFVDTEFIRPLPRQNPFSRAHDLDDKFVVTHAGNLGYVYDLETLLESANLLRDRRDLVFLIVGDGVARQRLVDKAAALGLENVRFLPFQPRSSLPLMRASSDVQLALYRPGAARFSMPSKVYEIMASGRPVLASAESTSDLSRLVMDTRCGICIEPNNPRKLADAIEALRVDADLRRRMGERGRTEVERHYSGPAVVERYDELLRRISRAAQKGHPHGTHHTCRESADARPGARRGT
jgi:colanic acid biosynthesis glycosyl transferase WcaI